MKLHPLPPQPRRALPPDTFAPDRRILAAIDRSLALADPRDDDLDYAIALDRARNAT